MYIFIKAIGEGGRVILREPGDSVDVEVVGRLVQQEQVRLRQNRPCAGLEVWGLGFGVWGLGLGAWGM